MDDRDEPHRIEIELTSHDPLHGGSPPPDPRPPTAELDDGLGTSGEPVVTDGGRRRLVIGVSGVALTALLVGIAVGRMDSRDAGEADDAGVVATTTVLRSAAPRTDASDTLPAAEPLPAPSSTSSTTSSDDASGGGSATGDLDVHPAVSAPGVEVVALTNRGHVVRIDVATGATTSTDVQRSQFGPPSLYAGEGWVLVPSYDEARGSTLLYDDGSRASVDVGSSWPLLANASSDRFWTGLQRLEGGGDPQLLLEMTPDGEATGVEIALNGHIPRMADPLGGVLVDAPGGSYVLTPESSTRVTVGRVLALGREQAFVHECDEQLVCAYVVVERSSGQRRELILDPELGASPTLESSAWWAFQDALNEAEDAVLVLAWNPTGSGGQSYGVLDLRDGGYTEIGEAIDVPAVRWSDDRSVFWLDRGRLRWFDRDTGESVLFSEELGTLNAFTIRPVPAG